ncbi:MAG: hypothetical protein IT168_26615 [Bryobacterales bacterium]|nr:hypothetical protein [Bryobacterales bacterium]
MGVQDEIARYRIVGKLGEGGMGAVYRATDTKLSREVAVRSEGATSNLHLWITDLAHGVPIRYKHGNGERSSRLVAGWPGTVLG